MRHFPLPMHPQAGPAARAMQAAAKQNKAWEMEEKLFENYRELTPEAIEGHASALSLDVDKFKADMESDAIKKEVEDDLAAGRSAGVRGTPTILINGARYQGPRTLDGFKQFIDEELKKVDELMKSGTPIDKVYETRCKAN
jgi:protein-disulfide isomerase